MLDVAHSKAKTSKRYVSKIPILYFSFGDEILPVHVTGNWPPKPDLYQGAKQRDQRGVWPLLIVIT